MPPPASSASRLRGVPVFLHSFSSSTAAQMINQHRDPRRISQPGSYILFIIYFIFSVQKSNLGTGGDTFPMATVSSSLVIQRGEGRGERSLIKPSPFPQKEKKEIYHKKIFGSISIDLTHVYETKCKLSNYQIGLEKTNQKTPRVRGGSDS